MLARCRQFCVLAAVRLVSVTEGSREFLSDNLLSSMLRLILGRSFLRTWGVSFLPEMLREGTAALLSVPVCHGLSCVHVF